MRSLIIGLSKNELVECSLLVLKEILASYLRLKTVFLTFLSSEIISRSKMWKIFGGKSKEQPPTTQEAIQKLRSTEEMLTKKSEFLEKKIDGEVQTARKFASKNKRGEHRVCISGKDFVCFSS